MKKIKEIERGGLTGSLYLEKLGYTYKIKGRINGKMTTLGRSYVYLSRKERALELMENEIDSILDITTLFNMNEYRKD